jgi:hypothetical protein
MHIHANLTNPNVASLYAAEAAEKAAAARQAAEVRKKLLQSASKLSSDIQVREFSGKERDSQEEADPKQGEKRGAVKRTQPADKTQAGSPISMWA